MLLFYVSLYHCLFFTSVSLYSHIFLRTCLHERVNIKMHICTGKIKTLSTCMPLTDVLLRDVNPFLLLRRSSAGSEGCHNIEESVEGIGTQSNEPEKGTQDE